MPTVTAARGGSMGVTMYSDGLAAVPPRIAVTIDATAAGSGGRSADFGLRHRFASAINSGFAPHASSLANASVRFPAATRCRLSCGVDAAENGGSPVRIAQ